MMEVPEQQSKLLRIFIGEQDKSRHRPLYEELVYEARKQGIAGATVLRGTLSYGASSRIHTAKLLELSSDLPIIVEIVDSEEKIREFLSAVTSIIEAAQCGAMATIENVDVIHYRTRS